MDNEYKESQLVLYLYRGRECGQFYNRGLTHVYGNTNEEWTNIWAYFSFLIIQADQLWKLVPIECVRNSPNQTGYFTIVFD